MKARNNRLLAMLLAVLLTVCQPVLAGAEGLSGGGQVLVNEIILTDEIDIAVPAPRSYESTANGTGSLYSTLNARQKVVYDKLKGISWARISSGNRVAEPISGINGTQLSGRVEDGEFRATGTSELVYNHIVEDVGAAVRALRYDRPDLLWLDRGAGMFFEFQGSGGWYTITEFGFSFMLAYGGRENIYRERMMQEARNIANTASQEKDMYSRVKRVHDILAQRSSYNYASLDASEDSILYRMAHSAYSGMFRDEYDPVCEGYSKAFKVVLNQMDIPCVLAVGGDSHMWNNVRMDDGRWYNVDLTWDDSDDRIIYNYFLKGTTDFRGNHTEKDPINGRVSSARYPKKHTVAYEYLGEDYPPLTYYDVPRSDYAYEQIEIVTKLGYFKGDGSGRFNPANRITRAEFANVVASVLGENADQYKGQYSFSDVSADKWYSGAAYWAKTSGVMEGSGGNFRPNDLISRQEMCTVLARALHLEGAGDKLFPDDGSIESWARDGVYACQAAGLVQGGSGGNFLPRNNALRREVAIVFARYAAMMGIVPEGEQ